MESPWAEMRNSKEVELWWGARAAGGPQSWGLGGWGAHELGLARKDKESDFTPSEVRSDCRVLNRSVCD